LKFGQIALIGGEMVKPISTLWLIHCHQLRSGIKSSASRTRLVITGGAKGCELLGNIQDHAIFIVTTFLDSLSFIWTQTRNALLPLIWKS
jgi:hypothetical protein